ncbi:MAG TPA: hypothetical protein VH796_04520 [Nitrososphaeraceae archaeon]
MEDSQSTIKNFNELARRYSQLTVDLQSNKDRASYCYGHPHNIHHSSMLQLEIAQLQLQP